jgi:hypothetical protein
MSDQRWDGFQLLLIEQLRSVIWAVVLQLAKYVPKS